MKKVLIAVEEPFCGKLFQKMLSQAGFYTALVEGVGAMLDFCRQHTPDLIVVDLDESSEPFWSAIHAVRSLRNLANLPFVGVSNAGSAETLQKAQSYGFHCVMPKQLEQQIMTTTIRSILTEAAEDRESASPSHLGRLIELSEEVQSLARGLSDRIGEFGEEGDELFGYIRSSGRDIASRLDGLNDGDLTDKDLRHDFRNMIGSVTGFSELILMEPTLSPQSEREFRRIRECSKEFVHILDRQRSS